MHLERNIGAEGEAHCSAARAACRAAQTICTRRLHVLQTTSWQMTREAPFLRKGGKLMGSQASNGSTLHSQQSGTGQGNARMIVFESQTALTAALPLKDQPMLIVEVGTLVGRAEVVHHQKHDRRKGDSHIKHSLI
ncbi:hypothetical protein [Pseudotabrizicola alkalilacus]|uniref:hypothetical protein n=1 Tax=Pseudotabrizicola alkalilacus TaxID=2305252 RepID=UPI0011C1CD46|nr:hypothetical protein [Pseudotabrizicola alkalilacus]